MEYRTLIYEKSNKIGTMTLNMPESLNAASDESVREFVDCLQNIREDNEVQVVVITGAGRCFSGGADVKKRLVPWSQRLRNNPQAFAEAKTDDDIAPEIMKDMRQVLIGSINGPTMGWGNCMVTNCDIRIASDKATFACNLVKMGLVPGWGSTYNMPRMMGFSKALELVLTGRTVNASEALDLGLVTKVVPHEQLHDATYELANQIAQYPALSVEWIKRLYQASLDNDLHNQLLLERVARAAHQTEDALEAAMAFVEKRKPVFKGK
jgi:2-(1,2-epoxy-1,2-dihydrophenyl)acetyl-CoA isomerase